MDVQTLADQQADTAAGRRLGDKIEQAFDQACRQKQLEVAACMLKGLDIALLGQPTSWDRRQAALSLMRLSRERLEGLRAAAEPRRVPAAGQGADPILELATL